MYWILNSFAVSFSFNLHLSLWVTLRCCAALFRGCICKDVCAFAGIFSKDKFAHDDLSSTAHSRVYVRVWSHMRVYTKGVCSCHLLKLTVSTKGCVPTLLYDGWVPIDCTVDENTGLSATRLLLYCSHGDMQAPLHQQHCPALWLLAKMLPSYLFLGEACCSAMGRCRREFFIEKYKEDALNWPAGGLEGWMGAC